MHPVCLLPCRHAVAAQLVVLFRSMQRWDDGQLCRHGVMFCMCCASSVCMSNPLIPCSFPPPLFLPCNLPQCDYLVGRHCTVFVLQSAPHNIMLVCLTCEVHACGCS
jgi:hypothetical protein